MATYDRYSSFRNNGGVSMVPYIEIPVRDTDRYETYKVNETRLDLLSNDYYGTPDYWWVIMQANSEYGANEFAIPDNASIRIPYPIGTVLDGYKTSIENYMKYYGYND